MGNHYSLIAPTTARKQIGCIAVYQQMPDDLSVSQRALWRYRRTDKGRANMKRSNMVNVEAHHIKPKAQFPELMFDLDNGISKCDKCHDKIHYGKYENERCLS